MTVASTQGTSIAARTRLGDAGSRIAQLIRHGIISGEFVPGTRIRQEDLAERFGASRVPVREALRQLEYEGLVTVIANTGAWISQFTLAECEEIYQIRERLEPLLLGISAPTLRSADLELLDDLAHRISIAGEDVATFLALDREFHWVTYAGAETAQLGELVQKLWNTTAPYRRAYVSRWNTDLRRVANEEHHLMLASLKDDEMEEAERILASHIRRTRQQLACHPDVFADGNVARRPRNPSPRGSS
ncbi:GntR family transcriptional regulator [Streptomyces sp. 6N223]|uniref:GntR family transcriptional regulator n=1 Tax=Streptomyces sp. 6N223 TaxID=3457412 RepID=UPI003FCFBD64